jgi:hypothetical protein
VPQAVNLGEGGRGAAVGGDIDRSAVVVGDHNRVEVFGDITYNYRDIAPSPVDAGTRESARRQLEALPLEEVPDRSEFCPPAPSCPSGRTATLSDGRSNSR